MFLRATTRKKDGKEHRYLSIVENARASERGALHNGELRIGRDCVQVNIALVVTPQGFPLAYEVLAGNTSD
jgi:transposase